ncbi:MAG: DUF512 domain-containing protein [Lachnospiraceae bacterium]|nr:DUF512 domain-containing protein [Lachnospiraceae bacterium]
MKKHVIDRILPGSIAEECGFEKGDKLISVNGTPIEDTFDYQYLISDEFLVLEVESVQGEVVEIEIEKDAEEDLGLVFENSFMDNYRSCKNKCIFCFIDQMPPGMRETLYFKDDDTRLSFLQGNYVTLTNLSDRDVEKIIRYRMEPINISFQTMNPELRCKMLNNRFAGEALKKAKQLYDAGIEMNGQIVLCKGVNDGEELEFSIGEMYKYAPVLRSVSVVPVGLSKYRDGLYPLEPFDAEDACEVVDRIERWQKKAFAEKGIHFVHASDEWYLLAGRKLPEEDRYDGYLQLENGVGMVRNFTEEFYGSLDIVVNRLGQTIYGKFEEDIGRPDKSKSAGGNNSLPVISVATGMLFGPILSALAKELEETVNRFGIGMKVKIYPIRNDFFGERITVAGLITGQDLISQLKGKDLGEILLIPDTMLRFGEEVFLDDITVTEVESALHCRLDIVKSSGSDFIESIMKYIP